MQQGGVLPFSSIGTVDDLLDRARQGAIARTGLEAIQNELTRQRNQKYWQMLAAPDDKVLELRAELRAIEQLAKSLLVKEAQGKVATQALYARAGLATDPTAPQGKRDNRQRKRPPARGKATTDNG